MLKIRLNQDEAEAIRRAAIHHGLSRSQWVRMVVRKALRREQPHQELS